MPELRTLDNGTFQMQVSIGTGANRLRGSVTSDSKRECRRLASELEAELRAQYEAKSSRNKKNVPFNAWCEEWYNMKKPRLAPTTYMSYRMYIDVHWIPYFGDKRLGKIDALDIERYISKKLENGLSPNTVRRQFFILRRLFYDALNTASPCRDVAPPERADFIITLPTDEDVNRLISLVGPRDRLIILLTAWCGLRTGETFALKRDDVDWDNGIIRIDESRSRTENGEYADKSPKSKNGYRNIAVPDQLMMLLRDYLQSKEYLALIESKNKKGVDTEHRIFTIRPDAWPERFQKLLSKHKIPRMRFYDLRHYHVSWLYDENIPDQYAAKRLGHNIAVLKGIYQHIKSSTENALDEKIKHSMQ